MDSTFEELKAYMIGINLNMQSNIEKMLRPILQNKKVTDEIKRCIQTVADVIEIYDLPKVIIICIESVRKHMINPGKYDPEFLRYLFYGVVYFMLLQTKNNIINQITNDVFRVVYDNLYDLVKYQLNRRRCP